LVSRSQWGPWTLDGLELVEGDLAIRSTRIDRVPDDWYRQTISIVQERHKAFNWLLGFEERYSETTTDT